MSAAQAWKEANVDKVRKHKLDWYYRNKKHQISKKRESRANKKLWLDSVKADLCCAVQTVVCLSKSG